MHILVPVDFSLASGNALRFACSIAGRLGASVKTLHVAGVPVSSPYTRSIRPDLHDMVLEGRREELRYFVKEHAVDCEQTSVDVVVGVPVPVINEFAESPDCVMVVMGTHGAGKGLSRVMGSVTSRVVKRLAVPVLAVPEEWEDTQVEKIVLAADRPAGAESNYWTLIHAIEEAHSHFTMLHIVDTEDENPGAVGSEILKQYHRSGGHAKVRSVSVTGEDAKASIERWCREDQADILIAVSRDHGFIASLFHKSTTKMLVLNAQLPVLVIPESWKAAFELEKEKVL